MNRKLEFAQMLLAKFCHEISGTIGAVNNSLELLLDVADDEMQKKALELALISSKQTLYRLLFYRYTYGISKASASIDLTFIRELIVNFIEQEKYSFSLLDFAPNLIEKCSQNIAKIICSIVVIGKNALLYGGNISISADNENMDAIINLEFSGSNVKFDQKIIDIIDGSIDEDVSTSNIHFYYIKELALEEQVSIKAFNVNDKIIYKIIF
jgi:hypothetical protein